MLNAECRSFAFYILKFTFYISLFFSLFLFTHFLPPFLAYAHRLHKAGFGRARKRYGEARWEGKGRGFSIPSNPLFIKSPGS